MLRKMCEPYRSANAISTGNKDIRNVQYTFIFNTITFIKFPPNLNCLADSRTGIRFSCVSFLSASCFIPKSVFLNLISFDYDCYPSRFVVVVVSCQTSRVRGHTKVLEP